MKKRKKKESKLGGMRDIFELILEHARGRKFSYIKRLIERGADQCAKKLGEEIIEAIISAIRGTKEMTLEEAAQVQYYLLATLVVRKIGWTAFIDECRRIVRGQSKKVRKKRQVRQR